MSYLAAKRNSGFTLIELLVVIAIIGILAGVASFAGSKYYQQSRDQERQANLQKIQVAVEQYRNKYGRYPEGCRGTDKWSAGQTSSLYRCTDGSNEYIKGIGEFLSVLPVENRFRTDGSVTSGSGYLYLVNADLTSYKIMASRLVESETVKQSHPFASCAPGCPAVNVLGNTVCGEGVERFNNSYAVWGGYASGATEAEVLNNTNKIWCH